MDTKELKKALIEIFRKNPNTSPKKYIDILSCLSEDLTCMAAAAICIMRELDKTLVVTGMDKNGVLLSVNEKAVSLNNKGKYCNEKKNYII